MSNLQQYLRTHLNWREELQAPPYCLKIQEDGNLILFKYSQIESDFSLDIVKEARGIIFEKDTWNIVCRPFYKFFNYGEPNAATIDWNNPVIVNEKIDGSLIKFYYYNNEWRVATNGTIDAHKALAYSTLKSNFYDLVMIAIENSGKSFEDFCSSLHPSCTYLFELVSPITKVVIPYENTELYKLGAYNVENDYFIHPHYLTNIDLKTPQEIEFNNLQEVIDRASSLDWMSEGFVVYDGYNRVKVKSPAYVLAHRTKNNGQVKIETLVHLIKINEIDEFLTYAPEFKEIVDNIYMFLTYLQMKMWDAGGDINLNNATTKKDFALAVINQNLPKIVQTYFFQWYDNRELNFNKYINKTRDTVIAREYFKYLQEKNN